MLLRENDQNPYNQAILSMQMAASKTSTVEQKSLLLESLEFIRSARKNEEKMRDMILDNAIAVRAAKEFHLYYGKTPNQVYPFSLMAHPVYIKKTNVAPPPILIG
jgi:hypothetical protein